MVRKGLSALLIIAAIAAAAGGFLYLSNVTPSVAPVSAAALADPSRPFVVKLHAQWCPVCMLTKGEWNQIEASYADRVKLVVFDSTTAAAVERSEAEAERLGLGDVLDRYHGATGMVVVIDGRTRDVIAAIGGRRSFEEYRDTIDAALSSL